MGKYFYLNVDNVEIFVFKRRQGEKKSIQKVNNVELFLFKRRQCGNISTFAFHFGCSIN